MVGCAAPQCTNRSDCGYKLFTFPRDPSRHAVWIENSLRTDFKEDADNRFCEVHFDEEQFQTVNGTTLKKLKNNAIPTLFHVNYQQPSAVLQICMITDQVYVWSLQYIHESPFRTNAKSFRHNIGLTQVKK